MRVALPTKEGQIFLQYDKAKEFTIYDVEIEWIKSKEIVFLGEMEKADFLTIQHINAVICANICSEEKTLLRTKRIELTYGVTGNVDDVMIRYLSGEALGTVEENALLRMKLDSRIKEDI